MRLKTASMMLFWFGILAQSIVILFAVPEYVEYGYSPYLAPEKEGQITLKNIINFTYHGFIHCVHIIAGYFLATGKKKGIVIGLGISLLEIFGAFSPGSIEYMNTLGWIVIRIFFVVVIVLIISGRKDLSKLQTTNWRPWKDPRTK